MSQRKPERCRNCPGYAWDNGQGFLSFEGPPKNGVVLVGEAGGETEAQTGKCFQGTSGKLIAHLFQREGLDREDFGVANVLACHPTDNKIDTHAAKEALGQCPFLGEALAKWQPRVCVALGATAFHALTDETLAITSARGYPFWSARYNCWVVPTFHPAFLARGQQRLSRVFLADIKRAVRLATEGMPEHVTHYALDPLPRAAERWADGYFAALSRDPAGTWLAFDIETPMSVKGVDEGELALDDDPTYTILRISFAYGEGEAMTIPWRGDYLGVIARLLGSEGVKLTWNGRYDCPRVVYNGVPIRGWNWDIMLAWHVLNSDLEKGLGFVTPFYVPTQTAWKHLSGATPEVYSATDSDMTWRIAQGVVGELRAQGMWDVFERHVVKLDVILDAMSKAGVPVDVEARRTFADELSVALQNFDTQVEAAVPDEARRLKVYKRKPKEELEGLREIPFTVTEKVCSVCGKKATKVHPHVKAGEGTIVTREREATAWAVPQPFKLSTVQLLEYQRVRGHRPILSRDKERRITFDEDAMKALVKRYPKDPLYPLVVDRREVEKLRGTITGEWDERTGRFVGGMPMDERGYTHTVYTHKPSTLRLSSINPNMQNQASGREDDGDEEGYQHRVKKLFVAEPGCVLAEIDFSGIEAVLVGYFAGSRDYVRLTKIDVHSAFASVMLYREKKISKPFDLTWSDDDLRAFLKDIKRRFKPMREIAKRTLHGTGYGMSPARMQTLYPESFPTIRIAGDLQRLYFDTFPDIKRWQTRTVDQAAERAYLRNPFGYRHWFWNVKTWKKVNGVWECSWGEDAKRALAFGPQSTAAGIIKEAMLAIWEAGLGGYLRLQVHDSLVCMLPERTAEQVGRAIFRIMTQPIPQLPLDPRWGMGAYLTIGAEAKQGRNWGDMQEVAW